MTYRINGNFQGIYVSRISLVEAPFVKYKILNKYKKVLSTAAIREIKFENEGPFVKYKTT